MFKIYLRGALHENRPKSKSISDLRLLQYVERERTHLETNIRTLYIIILPNGHDLPVTGLLFGGTRK